MEVMYLWVTPITDRTAIKGKSHVEILDSNKTIIAAADKILLVLEEKGKPRLNWGDLDRIEINCRYIAEQLNLYGYKVTIITKTDWIMDDFPYQTQIKRIRDNINALISAYHKLINSPEIVYWNSLNWQDANSLEQNLENLNILLELMKQSFKYSGTFYSGQEVVL